MTPPGRKIPITPGAQIVDAALNGTFNMEPSPGPDGQMGLIVVIDVPGARCALFLGHDLARDVKAMVGRACDAAAAGIILPTDQNGHGIT